MLRKKEKKDQEEVGFFNTFVLSNFVEAISLIASKHDDEVVLEDLPESLEVSSSGEKEELSRFDSLMFAWKMIGLSDSLLASIEKQSNSFDKILSSHPGFEALLVFSVGIVGISPKDREIPKAAARILRVMIRLGIAVNEKEFSVEAFVPLARMIAKFAEIGSSHFGVGIIGVDPDVAIVCLALGVVSSLIRSWADVTKTMKENERLPKKQQNKEIASWDLKQKYVVVICVGMVYFVKLLLYNLFLSNNLPAVIPLMKFLHKKVPIFKKIIGPCINVLFISIVHLWDKYLAKKMANIKKESMEKGRVDAQKIKQFFSTFFIQRVLIHLYKLKQFGLKTAEMYQFLIKLSVKGFFERKYLKFFSNIEKLFLEKRDIIS